MSTKIMRLLRFVVVSGALTLAQSVYGSPIPLNTFLQFSFLGAGDPATGCFPDDPNGEICLPGNNPPTFFLGAPPWTFIAPTGGVTLVVVDAFQAGDRFQAFDGLTSLGLTSAPIGTASCGNSPFACLANPNISRGIFPLSAGAHSISLLTTLSPTGSGTGFLAVQTVPEPTDLPLLVFGLLALFAWRKRVHKN